MPTGPPTVTAQRTPPCLRGGVAGVLHRPAVERRALPHPDRGHPHGGDRGAGPVAVASAGGSAHPSGGRRSMLAGSALATLARPPVQLPRPHRARGRDQRCSSWAPSPWPRCLCSPGTAVARRPARLAGTAVLAYVGAAATAVALLTAAAHRRLGDPAAGQRRPGPRRELLRHALDRLPGHPGRLHLPAVDRGPARPGTLAGRGRPLGARGLDAGGVAGSGYARAPRGLGRCARGGPAEPAHDGAAGAGRQPGSRGTLPGSGPPRRSPRCCCSRPARSPSSTRPGPSRCCSRASCGGPSWSSVDTAWWAVVPLALACASKQHLALLLPVLLLWRPFGWRRTVATGALTAALIAEHLPSGRPISSATSIASASLEFKENIFSLSLG